jgi:hypothetical protein
MHAIRNIVRKASGRTGVTLVELMITIVTFGIIMIVINNVFFSTNRLYGNTTVRAGQQMNVRAAMSVMISELRTAGCDPVADLSPVAPFISATGDTVHVQADYNGDGAISTVEPSETVLYYYDANLQAVMRDPGTGPQMIINNVAACAFTYFDGNNNALAAPVTGNAMVQIRSIGITVTTSTDAGGDMVTNTRVSLRNG